MSKRTPRHWVGYLDDEINGGFVLYHRERPDRSPPDVYLFHFNANQTINHFKYIAKGCLRPLGEHERAALRACPVC